MFFQVKGGTFSSRKMTMLLYECQLAERKTRRQLTLETFCAEKRYVVHTLIHYPLDFVQFDTTLASSRGVWPWSVCLTYCVPFQDNDDQASPV